MMDSEEFLRQVRERTGLDAQQAARAVDASFAALGRGLEAEVLDELAAVLAPRFATQLRAGAREGGPGGFLEAVAERERVGVGFAKEHAQVVCETLASALDDARREALRERLPAEVAALLVPFEPAPARRPVDLHPRVGHTLADARPGSSHPLSEAAPRAGHKHSLAVSDDPHADTRLSSSSGLSPERDHETLAEGKPGSQRPVSTGQGPDSPRPNTPEGKPPEGKPRKRDG